MRTASPQYPRWARGAARLLLIIFVSLTGTAAAQIPKLTLPDHIIPLRHEIELTLDPRQDTFGGVARIEVDVREPSDVIWLNAKQIVIGKAEVQQNGALLASQLVTSANEFVGLRMQRRVRGRVELRFEYQAHLDEKIQSGAYRRNVNGEWYAYTTFTPIEARRAFPCFDEPRFKTPWRVSLRVPQGDRAFANAAEATVINEPGGMKMVRFEETKPLPAELVAFAVGPFELYQGSNARVITPKGRAAEGKAAADASAIVVPRLEAFTGMPYAFGKLDHIALPDGLFDAVENPGLITYVADQLLVKPGQETARKTWEIRALETHEISHQWFGNLVTQATWRDVWLSEGFATWLEYKLMDQEETRDRQHIEGVRSRERVMRRDTSSTVRKQVASFEDIRKVYNRVVYDKGSSILMMLEGWLGEEKTREGMRGYLAAHRFGVASTEDLVSALKKPSGVDTGPAIYALADTTVVPEVQGKIECAPGSAKLHLEQKGVSTLPVCWRVEGGASGCAELGRGPKVVGLTHCATWVYLNAGGTGYYRTQWTGTQLKSLSLASLTAAERLTLVFDLRAQKGERTAADAMLAKLAEDREPEVSQAATAGSK